MTRVVMMMVVLSAFAAIADAANHTALFVAGRNAVEKGEYDKAEEHFRKASAAQPNNADYHFWLGAVYGMQTQRANLVKKASLASKMRASFEKAVAIDPGHYQARMSLIDYYKLAPAVMGGGSDKALEQVREIRKRDALRGRWAMAKVHLHDKNVEAAREEFAQSVRENPASGPARVAYASFLISHDKNYPPAIEELERSLKVAPDYMPAAYQIGRVSALAKVNLDRGEEALKRYLGHQPADDEPHHGRAHYWLGMIYEAKGRKAEARQSFSVALTMLPEFKEAAEALKRVK
jgi:tetratricopeptide (TPR) repeat protein